VTGLGVSALLLLSACGGGGDPGAADPGPGAVVAASAPVRGGELRVGLEAESTSLLPGAASFSPSGWTVAHAIYDTLMAEAEDGSIRPFLAESVTPAGDLTAWTVRLRSGITFHDGTPLDAPTLRAAFDEFLTAPGATTAGVLAGVRELRVDDELTVTYVLDEPDAHFPDVLTEAAGMPFSVEAARAAGDRAGERPVGTGPFRLERWDRDDRIVVVRNEDYWRDGLPHLDRITFRPLPDERSRVQALTTGGLDVVQTLRGSSVRLLQEAEDDGVTTLLTAHDDAGITVMNVLRPPFDDVRIRRAFAHAVDRTAVAAALGDDGLVEPATQFVGRESPWWSERVAAAGAAYDPDEARRLVRAYVEDPDRSDGRPVGTPPSVDYGCVDDPSLAELSFLVQRSAEDIGFDVSLTIRDQGSHVAVTMGDASTEPPFAGDFSVNCYRIIPAGGIASTLAAAFGDPSEVATNLSNHHTPELARLLDQLQATTDPEAQFDLVERIGVLVNEAAPVAYGTATPAALGVRDSVSDLAGWTLPDGAKGSGTRRAIARWAEVWIDG
jgi:peptide/nickel transport system substrate-binding protein